MDIAQGMQEKLSARLSGAVHVEVGMSYGNPSIDDALDRLHEQFVRRIVVLPMYPQYSGTTTASVFDAVTRSLSRRRWVPELRFINHYHDSAGYIAALAASIRDHWDMHGRGERLLMSFHGVPKKTLLDGDPYHCQCQKTARLVAETLELDDDEWQVSFQSRVGRAEWLRPYTDETLEAWGTERAGLVDVICPGFSADCLETLEEIAMENAETFRSSGGGDLRYIPALNARDDHVSFLARTIEKSVTGWPEADPDWSLSEASRQLEKSRQRAMEMGATC
jgi:ferrochelatase